MAPKVAEAPRGTRVYLTGEPPEWLTCPICMEAMLEPSQLDLVHNCSHAFCRLCLEQTISHSRSATPMCPVCRAQAQNDGMKPSINLCQAIDEVKVACRFGLVPVGGGWETGDVEEGQCAARLKLSDVEAHEQEVHGVEPAPPPAPSGHHVNVVVQQEGGREVFFRIRSTTPLRRLFMTYCQQVRGYLSNVTFMFNGRRIQHDDSTTDVGIVDHDRIDAVTTRTGPAYMPFNGLVRSVHPSPFSTDVSPSSPGTISIRLRTAVEPTWFVGGCDVGVFQNLWYSYWGGAQERGLQGRPPFAFCDEELTQRVMLLRLDPDLFPSTMEGAAVQQALDVMRYNMRGINASYYGGDKWSWQRYTRQRPVGRLAVEEDAREGGLPVRRIHVKLDGIPLEGDSWYALVVLHGNHLTQPTVHYQQPTQLHGQWYEDYLVPFKTGVSDALEGGWESATDLMYTIAAAATVVDAGTVGEAVSGEDGDVEKYTGMFSLIADSLESVLVVIQQQLADRNVPYSYGWSIIAITLFVKILTYPLTKVQVESGMNQQNLAPKIKAIKDRYGEDKEKINELTNKLYAEYEVNPLAGCLPTIATIPIFIGLYRSLSNIASEGLLEDAGFYWIPNLAGPVDMEDRGIGWLTNLDANGVPPLGWHDTICYLALPVLLVGLQYFSTSLVTPPKTDDEDDKSSVLLKILPLFIGWIAINLPSGLALYYFANTFLTTAQQVYLRKLGGANLQVQDIQEFKQKPGTSRRTGSPILYMDEALVKLDAEASGIKTSTEDVEEVDPLEGVPAQLRLSLEMFAEDDELRVIYDDVVENGYGEEVLGKYYNSAEWNQKINDKMVERAWTSGSMGVTLEPTEEKVIWDRPIVRRAKRALRKPREVSEALMAKGRMETPEIAPVGPAAAPPSAEALKAAEGLTL